MSVFATRHRPARSNKVARPRAHRGDAPKFEIYPESIYLRRWATLQANRYQNLLGTISAAPKAGR